MDGWMAESWAKSSLQSLPKHCIGAFIPVDLEEYIQKQERTIVVGFKRGDIFLA